MNCEVKFDTNCWVTVVTSKKQRFVLLGAAGFLGFHLSKFIVENYDSHVVMVDNFIRGEKDEDLLNLINSNSIEFRQLNLCDAKSYDELFEPSDIVFNLAAFNGTQNFYSSPFEVLFNSSLPGIIAPEKAASAGVSKYVYFGSSESYAGGFELGLVDIPTPEEVPFVITDPANPRWSYAISKQIGEIACHSLSERLNFTILRIHNIYGPRMGFEHVIPDLIRNFSNMDGRVMGVSQTRAFLYVDDAVQTIMKVIDNARSRNETYNVGSEREVTVGVLAEKLCGVMDIAIEIIPTLPPQGSVERRLPDINKIKQIAEIPETSIEIGLQKTVDWYLKLFSKD